MLGDELLELGAHDSVTPERELGIDPVLDGLYPERLEAACLQPRERLGLEVGQGPAAPQRLGFPQQSRGPARIAVRKRLPPGRYLLLEHV